METVINLNVPLIWITESVDSFMFVTGAIYLVSYIKTLISRLVARCDALIHADKDTIAPRRMNRTDLLAYVAIIERERR